MAVFSLMMTGAGTAAMWIGVQGGPNFVANSEVKAQSAFPYLGLNGRLKGVKTETAALGGVTIGYDFIKEGFLGYDWPNWLKYFSFAIDLTYNNFSQGAQTVKAKGPLGVVPLQISRADGYMLVLSFLFIAKYGFLPTPEIPFGRLIPYVGVGPGIFFSAVETSSSFSGYPSSDSAEVGIVTEAGVRYMVRHNISLDAAFRYRYAVPSYDVDYYSNLGNFNIVGRIPTQQFNAIFRVTYHF
jgi:opacity protein-like surface antigen